MQHIIFARVTIAATAVALVLMASVPALRAADAQTGAETPPPGHSMMMSGHDHMSMSAADGRELVHFPPEMRMHMLGNMRDHVETLNGILHDLAGADYAGAAKLASTRLGLDSPAAASCKPKGAKASAAAPSAMDEMMALYMPEPMKALGLGMHTAATDFAAAAERVATTHDPAPAMKALSEVTEHCVACHAAYRLQ